MRSLIDSFISQSTGSGNDTDLSLVVDIARHDTNLTFSGLNDSGAVGSNKASGTLTSHHLFNAYHIHGGNSFSDANNKGDLTGDSFFDSSGSTERRNVDHGSFSLSFLDSFRQLSENGESKMHRASLARVSSSNNFSSVSNSLFRVEGSVFTGETLDENFSVLVDEHLGHSLFSICEASCRGGNHRVDLG